MTSDTPSELKLEIGHVLFIDIVGYSKLLITEQSNQIQTLKEIVRETEQVRLAEAEGKLLRLPTGDGGAVVFRNSPEAPVLCAIEIAKALKNHPELRIRMGVHSGPVNEIADLNEQANIAGAGINLAQRIMDCGDAGHILLSKRVADDLEQYPRWRPLLHELGECEIKHGTRIFVVNVYSDEWGNAKLPEKFNPQQDGMKAATSTDASVRKSNAMRWAGIAAVILILGGMGAWFFRFQSSLKEPAHAVGASSMTSPGSSVIEKSIAVLPFDNASGNADTEYLSDGISEALINSLTELHQLRVIARSTAFRYKGKQVDPQGVGRELKVQTVLMGIIRQLGDRLNVQVDLVDTATGAQLWGQEYERKLADVLAVKQALVREVTEKLKLRLTGEEQRQLTQRDTTNPEAYQFYLKGRYYWNKRTAENVKKASDQFQQAAEKDPNYALAYVGLADCVLLEEDYVGTPASESYAKAEGFAQRALQLDGSLAEANASLGFIYTGLWQWERAEEEFKRSINLNPNYATAPHWYGLYLLNVGRTDEAFDELKRAHEMDPLAAVIETSLTYAYFAKGDLEGAIAECKKVVELDPNYPRAREYLGLGYLKQKRYAEALAELQKAVELSGRERRPLRDLGYGFAISGKRVEALAVLKELQAKYEKHEAIGQDLAAVYAGLGDKDQAFAWLEKDFQARSGLLAWIRWTPPFESLRDDPRHADLLRRMGLKP
jgi:TolB-like protein/Tfp pilus assembly protein PilF/class 3 adenylate cyclase